jgi:hypothetical protein
MSKKIKQFRFYGDNNEKNYPSNRDKSQYQSGQVFSDLEVFPISQLGIQGPPGTKFYLNGSVNPLTIGVSGIYDLDIKNGARITSLEFDRDSLNRIENNSYLFIDILYGEEDD